MATPSNNTIAQAIYESTKDKSGSALALSEKKVVQFLARRRLLSKSQDILLALHKIINHAEGRIIVHITSAQVLTEHIRREIAHALKSHYGAKSAILEEEVDKNLLGGMRIEVNDEVIDLSIKNKIEKLQAYLTR